MIKKNFGKLIVGSVLILLPMVVGLLLWNRLPAEMATHWGVGNVPNGWSGRGMVVFGIPLLMLALHWVCMLISTTDARMKEQNKKALNLIFWIVPVLTIFVCAMIYATALGVTLNMDTACLVLTGVLFLIVGNYLPKCKQNSYLGIKLPWTLNSEANWNATHRFAGKVWMLGGALFLGCVFLPKNALAVALVVLLPLLVIAPLAYSYLYHRKYDQ